MKPDFSKIKAEDLKVKQMASCKCDVESVEPWETAEHITVKPCFSKEDIKDDEQLHYAAGIAPFLRGPYSTMYVQRP